MPEETRAENFMAIALFKKRYLYLKFLLIYTCKKLETVMLNKQHFLKIIFIIISVYKSIPIYYGSNLRSQFTRQLRDQRILYKQFSFI